MSEIKETEKLSENEWKSDSMWVPLLILLLCLGWGNPDNPKINELEKKVARLEGQMSMVGGIFHE